MRKNLADEELVWLFWPGKHMPLLTTRRAEMILLRVRIIAALFALLTALWIAIDAYVLPWPAWGKLAAGRLVASMAFALLAISFRGSSRMRDTYIALAALYLIPTVFYVFSYTVMQQTDANGLTSTIAGIYAFLPFVMVAGLGMFPLTAIEGMAFALPVVGAEFAASLAGLDMLNLSHLIGTVWLSGMIAAVATMSGMSQLGFMIALVRQAVRDPLTSCFSRMSGEELLEIQFIIATRSNTPLSVAFVDLDNFKSVNDTYGHDAGDQILVAATTAIRAGLRTGDMLVRWGGEEFILILPSSYCDEAGKVLARLRETGLGMRPDGNPVTASIGLAERTLDSTDDWRKLVEIADQRMYAAKQGGKDRIVACGANSPA
ncbi:MAG: GGDEF domain-containing protein [Nitrosomonadales bacterium]|nr:MAG: GGDEF domain-containing protein [Nitrosomonadales bacterium]